MFEKIDCWFIITWCVCFYPPLDKVGAGDIGVASEVCRFVELILEKQWMDFLNFTHKYIP